jgi:hypothetical protein
MISIKSLADLLTLNPSGRCLPLVNPRVDRPFRPSSGRAVTERLESRNFCDPTNCRGLGVTLYSIHSRFLRLSFRCFAANPPHDQSAIWFGVLSTFEFDIVSHSILTQLRNSACPLCGALGHIRYVAVPLTAARTLSRCHSGIYAGFAEGKF